MYAFKLTQQAKDEGFSGGSINCTTRGHMFDIGAALRKPGEETEVDPDGVFTVDDVILAQILAGHPALERTEVPEDAQPIPVPGAEDSPKELDRPWQRQQPDPSATFATAVAEPAEVPAEHADEPATEEEAVAVGEAVSGDPPRFTGWRADAADQPTDSES